MGNLTSKVWLTMGGIVLLSHHSSEGVLAANLKSNVWGIHTFYTPDSPLLILRGGDDSNTDATTSNVSAATTLENTNVQSPESEEPTLDQKVQAAMQKLGMASSASTTEKTLDSVEESENCKDGVCTIPTQLEQNEEENESKSTPSPKELDPNVLAKSIAKEMHVDEQLAMAAIGATSVIGDNNRRSYNEQAARDMIQQELNLIEKIPSDDPNVKILTEEGFDSFLSRRALAFADNSIADARAILLADQMDEEDEKAANEEAEARAQVRKESTKNTMEKPDLIEVKTNFDPTALPATPKAKPSPAAPDAGMPKPAAKDTVVFDASTSQIQELVLESPVPVLLDIYADWCGPCKALTPALEEMAIKSGGAFRLVKINSDNERPVSGALEVTALPTVFGIRDGKIVNMFQGMPKSEDMMRNFMMGLFGAAPFKPAVTDQEADKYKELTTKLVKTAGSACFPFSARERLADRITTKLDDLVKNDSAPDVEGAATLLRTLFNNVVKDPYEQKYRKINLENKLIAGKFANNAEILSVLKSVGFSKSGTELTLGKGKKVINVAPLVIARDCIEKWIQKNRKEMAAAARRRKDEIDRVKVQEEIEAKNQEELHEEKEEKDTDEDDIDPTTCSLRLRLDGKKKVHEVALNEDEPLSAILTSLNIDDSEDEVQITCVAKRMVVKSSDHEAMKKSLRSHGLMPSAAVVIKVGGREASTGSSLKERAAEKRKKKGSHTMQSIGIYAKDDNNKAELIDGGGGVWYEHDVSEDELEQKDEDIEKDQSESTEVSEDSTQEDNGSDSGDDA